MFERIVQAMMFMSGSRVGFFRGDVKGLLDDIQALKPTIFVSVPRLLNRIYDKVEEGRGEGVGDGEEGKGYFLEMRIAVWLAVNLANQNSWLI